MFSLWYSDNLCACKLGDDSLFDSEPINDKVKPTEEQPRNVICKTLKTNLKCFLSFNLRSCHKVMTASFYNVHYLNIKSMSITLHKSQHYAKIREKSNALAKNQVSSNILRTFVKKFPWIVFFWDRSMLNFFH
jgi:hypothetical protein